MKNAMILTFKNKKTWMNILKFIVVNGALVLVMIPLLTLIMTSFKSLEDIMLHPTSFFPTKWVFTNFVTVLKEFPFMRYLANTIFVTVLNSFGVVLSSALVAYGFSRFNFKYKNLIFTIMLSTIFIPAQILQIPMFELYRSLGWFNSYYPMILPGFLGGGIVNVFLIRQFMSNLPKQMYEAAVVDGANEFQIFSRIAVPLCKPVLLTVFIFTFVGTWNDFYSPLLYLTDDSKYTLAYGLYMTFSKFEVAGQTAWNLVSAANIVFVIPIIAMYFFFQKYFVEGITLGSVKE